MVWFSLIFNSHVQNQTTSKQTINILHLHKTLRYCIHII